MPGPRLSCLSVSRRLPVRGGVQIAARDRRTRRLSSQESRVRVCFLGSPVLRWVQSTGFGALGVGSLSRDFPTSAEGVRAEGRWVSPRSRPGYLAITMAIILQKQK